MRAASEQNVDGELTGVVRVDPKARALSRLAPGQILAIDIVDLDRATADAIVRRQPAAVLNASACISGRYPSLGPRVLLDAGIPVVDQLGPDMLAIRDGQKISVRAGQVLRKNKLIAEGQRLEKEAVLAALDQARTGLAIQMDAFAASLTDHLERDRSLLLERAGLPQLATNLQGRHVFIASRGADLATDLRRARRYLRDARPVIIAVDDACEELRSARLQADIILGDVATLSESYLKSAAEFVLTTHAPGFRTGSTLLGELGVGYQTVDSAINATDLAILLAEAAGASLIVTAGIGHSIDEFLDRGQATMASNLLARLRASDRVVTTHAVVELSRRQVPTWLLLTMLVAALAALGVALAVTEAGRSVLTFLLSAAADSAAVKEVALC
ncbi:putative cytokinetic ring protein SteA [Buchananella hordeovulneris]|uniref:putative cytokinetic ring protein SteA n=1 Tax=Buchananella hordeovulneris TaxID=52770 RepID=UPI0026DA9CA1|nr:putative cytokinetic ring protein SteA [Buchananella hordeovulneris]MDO5081285.1 putative cytokinetic ring protein SteA [Buchananella hordeovulneris]